MKWKSLIGGGLMAGVCAVVLAQADLSVLRMWPELLSRFWTQGASSSESATSIADLSKPSRSEVYLKQSRAFIFTEATSNQKLKIRDSVFVGPNSEATLYISEEFGGGEIHIAENSVVTLSTAGFKKDIPTLEIKQGAIQIVKAPKKRAPRKRAKNKRQTESAKVATTPASGKALSPVEMEVPEQPMLVITSGAQAIAFDETLGQSKITISETKEIVVQTIASVQKPAPEEIPENPAPNEAAPVKVVAIANIEDLWLEPALALAEEITQSSAEPEQAQLDEIQADILEDMPEATIASREPANEELPSPPQNISEKAPEPIAEVAAIEEAPQPKDETFEEDTAPTVKSLLLDAPEEVALKELQFEALFLLVKRSYQEGTSKATASDIDIAFNKEWDLNHRISLLGKAQIAALNLSTTATKAPRPFEVGAEIKYHFQPSEKAQPAKEEAKAEIEKTWSISAIAGFSFKGSLGTGRPSYSNVYSPTFGFDLIRNFSASQHISFMPRYSWINSEIYSFHLPVIYYWDRRWGVHVSFSKLVLGSNPLSKFQAISGGLTFKF